jgi:mono/diheme cytochrome c family protein
MKKWAKRLGIGLGALVCVLLLAGFGVYGTSRWKQATTYEITAASIDVPEAPDLVEGERLYIARACGSPECHDADGGGHVMMQDGPFGTITASNLTQVTRDFTASDWNRAVRHGMRADSTSLVFMPSVDFVNMSDRELALLAAYVRSLPVVDRDLPEMDIGMLARAIDLAGLLELFPASAIDHASVANPDPEPGRTVEYGEYIAALCSGCHGAHFSGGPIPGAPPEMGTPLNLTPHETGLAGWTEDDLRTVLRTGVTPDGHQIDSAQMPWPAMSRMSDEEIGALYMFLQSLPPLEEGNR